MKKFKQLLSRFGLTAGTVGLIIAGAAAFSAFEAHVVNVTATIAEATDISTQALTYGTVFPQEILHQPITLSLSSSFSSSDALGVDYVIKQKPKCGLPVSPTGSSTPVSYSAFGQVTENAQGVFSCVDQGYVMLPLLCPYLSKTSDNAADTSVPSFHGPTSPADWTDAVSVATQAVGHLTQADSSTTWDIDLHTPCFKGQCAQDWSSYVHTANPNANPATYMADPSLEHQQMGCDLWYELTNVSRSGTPTTTTTVAVTANDLDNTSSNPAVVALDGLNKWFMYNDTTDTVDNTLGSFVAGPATPSYGTGSVKFTLAASPLDRKNIGTYRFSGTLLSAITQMGFGVYSNSGVSGPNESPYLVFDVDFATSTISGYQNRLVYVPTVNGAVPQDTWNSFDVINSGNALWVWSGYAKGPDKVASTADDNTWPDGNTNLSRTWNSIKAAFPNAKVLSGAGQLGVRVGEPGPTGYSGNVDFFKIATGGTPTVYDFGN